MLARERGYIAKAGFVATMAVCLLACCTRGEEKVSEQKEKKTQQERKIIELRIVMPKREAVLGEEIKYTLEFENKHYHPIVFYWSNHKFYQFVTETITEPSGKQTVRSAGIFSLIRLDWPSFTLKPGEKAKYETSYLTSTSDEPGVYTFEAEFEYLGIRTKAEPVKVVVKPKNP